MFHAAFKGSWSYKNKIKMKTVKNGKVYDTETATLVAEWDNGMCRGDFRACEEALYKTKRGQYFVCGSGGPLTSYAVSRGSGSCGSSEIRLTSPEGARSWCENHEIAADIIAANFKIEEG